MLMDMDWVEFWVKNGRSPDLVKILNRSLEEGSHMDWYKSKITAAVGILWYYHLFHFSCIC